MTWTDITNGSQSWSKVTNGSQSWNAVLSHTTTRNFSRFVLLGDRRDDSVVGLFPHFRTQDSTGRGVAFYMTVTGPILLSATTPGVR